MQSRGKIVVSWIRALHIYLSMFAFLALVFFALTGLMLSHPNWFALDEPATLRRTVSLPTELLAEPDQLALVECLRTEHGARGEVVNLEVDPDVLFIAFRGPGRSADVQVNRRTGETQITQETTGLLGRLTDLHRAHHAGPLWRVFVDGAAVLLLFSSVSGLVLLYSLPRRRRFGLIALGVGIGLFVWAWVALIP